MNDKPLLSRYLNRPGETPSDPAVQETDVDGSEDFGAFGVLRGPRERAVMLELIRKNGDVLAVGYGWIEKVEFIPGAITLHLPGQKIVLKGRNLNTAVRGHFGLLQALIRHRASWVRQSDNAVVMQAEREAVIVESIEW